MVRVSMAGDGGAQHGQRDGEDDFSFHRCE
jgi:hypothetical protein